MIVGGGTFVWSSTFPLSLTWDFFEQKNGASDLAEMRKLIMRHIHPRPAPHEDPKVGSIILEDPWFLAESDWIPAPIDWSRNIVQGKTYDLSERIGRRLWAQVELARQMAWARQHELDVVPTTVVHSRVIGGRPANAV